MSGIKVISILFKLRYILKGLCWGTFAGLHKTKMVPENMEGGAFANTEEWTAFHCFVKTAGKIDQRKIQDLVAGKVVKGEVEVYC